MRRQPPVGSATPTDSHNSPSVACAPPCHAHGVRHTPPTPLRSPVLDDSFFFMPYEQQPRPRFDMVSRYVIIIGLDGYVAAIVLLCITGLVVDVLIVVKNASS
jgi:hypothetical protein